MHHEEEEEEEDDVSEDHDDVTHCMTQWTNRLAQQKGFFVH